MSRVFRYALATVLATFALIAVGGLARLQPAGSGCGNDWPRCNGSWLPPLAWAPLVEYLHRGIALTVVLLTAATVLVAFRTPGTPRNVRHFALAGLAAIVVQSAIGGIAAVWGAPAGVAVLHLTAAMLFLACAIATLAAAAAGRGAPTRLAELGRGPSRAADRTFAIIASLAATITLVLVIFGASTSVSGAFACATWPLCAEGAPTASGQTLIHLGYRATALLGSRLRHDPDTGDHCTPVGGAAERAERRRSTHRRSHLDFGATPRRRHPHLDRHGRGVAGGLGTTTGASNRAAHGAFSRIELGAHRFPKCG
jgi:heme A synthase